MLLPTPQLYALDCKTCFLSLKRFVASRRAQMSLRDNSQRNSLAWLTVRSKTASKSTAPSGSKKGSRKLNASIEGDTSASLKERQESRSNVRDAPASPPDAQEDDSDAGSNTTNPSDTNHGGYKAVLLAIGESLFDFILLSVRLPRRWKTLATENATPLAHGASLAPPLRYAHLLVLLVIYFASLSEVNILNAVYFIIFVAFFVSPDISRCGVLRFWRPLSDPGFPR